jgi:hypothetical protein
MQLTHMHWGLATSLPISSNAELIVLRASAQEKHTTDTAREVVAQSNQGLHLLILVEPDVSIAKMHKDGLFKLLHQSSSTYPRTGLRMATGRILHQVKQT